MRQDEERCKRCKGKGKFETSSGWSPCPICYGSGSLTPEVDTRCPICKQPQTSGFHGADCVPTREGRE